MDADRFFKWTKWFMILSVVLAIAVMVTVVVVGAHFLAKVW